jgi:hypothetical protein
MSAAQRRPYPICDDHWRSRWLVLPSWNVLHRVSEIDWDDGDMRSGRGVTLCGRAGELSMPGVFSRTSLTRCAHCCRLAGVPRGEGAPFNQDIEERP